MSSKLTDLEKKLAQLLDEPMPDKVELVETSFEIGKIVASAGLQNYELKPIKVYKETVSQDNAQYEMSKYIDKLIEKLILFSFKEFFDTKDEAFEIIEDGRSIPCDKFGDEIAEKFGVEVTSARVNKNWDDDFEITLEARSWLKELLTRYQVPIIFRCNFGNINATYYRTLNDIEDAAYALNSADVITRNLFDKSEEEIDEFVKELEKMVTFFSLTHSLPSID